jgi:acetyltransferase-like isoleucine patch superfamily enzyme
MNSNETAKTRPASARERMEAGLWYDANFDAELSAERLRVQDLCLELNSTRPSDTERVAAIRERVFPNVAANAEVLIPVQTDYGRNVHIGEGSFVNHGAYFMDGAQITIGTNCFIGPSCGFYTASHPMLARDRNRGYENARPISIGNDVWFGGNVVVLPGVEIGDGAVIGAGSVVTRNIPPRCVAAGNPCRVLRELTEDDALTDEQLGI